MIKRGVQIYCYGEAQMKDRLFVSNGTEMVKGYCNGYYFNDNAYKAKKPWRLINDQEKEMILSGIPNIDYKSNIGLIKISDKAKRCFADLKLSSVSSYEDLELLKKKHTENYMEAIETLDEDFFKYLITNDNLDKLGIHIGLSNVETATIDGNGKYVGLHVDFWDRLSLLQLEKATNRICVNLGKEDRYFLFINLTMEQIYADLPAKNKAYHEYNRSELINIFFKTNENYPVVKLRVKPYEAYIAPTESIIHDGSTEGNMFPDITLTTRGYFNVSKNFQLLSNT